MHPVAVSLKAMKNTIREIAPALSRPQSYLLGQAGSEVGRICPPVSAFPGQAFPGAPLLAPRIKRGRLYKHGRHH
jgi:hypothetical protein